MTLKMKIWFYGDLPTVHYLDNTDSRVYQISAGKSRSGG